MPFWPISMTQSLAAPLPPRLEIGATVRTPSGRFVEIIALTRGERGLEATVRNADGEIFRLLTTLLTGCPGE